MRRPKAIDLLGGGILLGGMVVLGHAAFLRVQEEAWQRSARRSSLPAALPQAAAVEFEVPPAPAEPLRRVRASRPKTGAPIARIRLDRLGIDAMVAEGTDPGTLRLGPGHMQGSALPGEADNCIIAGHRDGAFQRLRGVKKGDRVVLENALGVNHYRVVGVEVVAKEDTHALEPSGDPLLTLVTCYPIHYVGPAPQRLVVRAELVARTEAQAERPAEDRAGS